MLSAFYVLQNVLNALSDLFFISDTVKQALLLYLLYRCVNSDKRIRGALHVTQ